MTPTPQPGAGVGPMERFLQLSRLGRIHPDIVTVARTQDAALAALTEECDAIRSERDAWHRNAEEAKQYWEQKYAALTRQRDELLAAGDALFQWLTCDIGCGGGKNCQCGRAAAIDRWEITSARGEAVQGCPHCGDVSKHPPEAPDVCPDYERFLSDVQP